MFGLKSLDKALNDFSHFWQLMVVMVVLVFYIPPTAKVILITERRPWFKILSERLEKRENELMSPNLQGQ